MLSVIIAFTFDIAKVFLKMSQNSQENLLCYSLFFNKVAGIMPATLLKERLWHRCFPVNSAKFLRTPFFKERLRATAFYIRDIH